MVERQQSGANPSVHDVAASLARRDQAHSSLIAARAPQWGVGDPLLRDGIRIDVNAERSPGKDGELLRGVGAVEVECRVGFGEAFLLRQPNSVVERNAIRHRVENEIAGAAPC